MRIVSNNHKPAISGLSYQVQMERFELDENAERSIWEFSVTGLSQF